MGPVGGGEILIILLVALIFLGPDKLPDVARQLGRAMAKLRRISAGFEREMRSAMSDLTEQEARERGQRAAGRPPEPGLIRPAPEELDGDGAGLSGEPDQPTSS